MKLYGMLDSPYVRRVAISLDCYGVPFEHHPLSVFSDFEAFARVNPVVKAPTLVLDDGTVLMDSNLILDHFEAQASRPLLPPTDRHRVLARTGLALVACEKAVQVVYERRLRPEAKQHGPWLERVSLQLRAACAGLEASARAEVDTLDQAAISSAVAWAFIQHVAADLIDPANYPGWSREARALNDSALFRRYPLEPAAPTQIPIRTQSEPDYSI
ncbi:glutathione S-transferase [Metapseudomonas otitidis]|uniref:glutathione S-transferase n=1 Tax=Metapseudomonas otitidis TaxID=319939 RepID=UPI00321658DB